VREESIQTLWDLAEDDEAKLVMLQPQFGLLPILIQMIRVETGEILRKTFGCLWFLSRARENEAVIMKRETGLAELLLHHAKTISPHEEVCMNILRNCAFHPDTHDYLLSPETGYLEYNKDLLINSPLSSWSYRTFSAISTALTDETVYHLVNYNIPQLLLNRLILSGSDPNEWIGRYGGLEDFLMTFLMNFSTLEKGCEALREFNPKPFLLNLFRASTNMEKIRSFCILSNLYPLEEEPLMRDDEESLMNTLVDLYRATIDSSNEQISQELADLLDYEFGMFLIRDSTAVFRNLSFQSSRKKHLLLNDQLSFSSIMNTENDNNDNSLEEVNTYSDELFVCLYRTIENILSEREDFCLRDNVALQLVGGGKNDYESLHYCLECLLQLTYHFPENEIGNSEWYRRFSVVQDNNSFDGTPSKFYLEDLLNKLLGTHDRGIWKASKIMGKILLERLLELRKYR
jgi:hypothetical protein